MHQNYLRREQNKIFSAASFRELIIDSPVTSTWAQAGEDERSHQTSIVSIVRVRNTGRQFDTESNIYISVLKKSHGLRRCSTH